MVVRDIMRTYHGEIRVHNLFYHQDVGIINTAYRGWVKLSYTNCEVVRLALEMLNTAVLSARIVVFICDKDAGHDSGDVEEATKHDIYELVDSIYKDNGKEPTETETIEVITRDYYDHQPLPGDEEDFTPNENSATQSEPVSDDEDNEADEANDSDIVDLLGGIYDE